MVEIIPHKIDITKVIQSVVTHGSGAVSLFIGTTRNISKGKRVVKLDYEAYEPMATKMMEKIETECRPRWDLNDISIVHRTGVVPVGEASVVIAVSSAHRKESFAACRYLIDRLKEEVPIWKREYFEDGTTEWSNVP